MGTSEYSTAITILILFDNLKWRDIFKHWRWEIFGNSIAKKVVGSKNNVRQSGFGAIFAKSLPLGDARALESAIYAAVREYNRQLDGCIKWYKYQSRDAIRKAGIKNYVVFYRGQG